MRRKSLTWLAAIVAVTAVVATPDTGRWPSSFDRVAPSVTAGFMPAVGAQQEEPGSPRSTARVTILQLNDVYSTGPIDGLGGLARVATLKQKIAEGGRTPFLVLAGDF